MLNALNTKILIAILAALAGIAATVAHIEHTNAAAAAIVQQQQAAQKAAKDHDDAFRAAVDRKRKSTRSFAGHESGTWQHYLP